MRLRKSAFPGAYVWTLALCLCFSACTTLHKRAEQYYEAGAYEESVATYDEILRKDPADTDAIVGRLKARQRLIDTKLIEVRKSRMGENEANAIEILRHVVELEDAWGFYPKGAVAYTQQEESGEALKYLDEEVNDALERKFPLKASYLLRHFGKIFQGDLQQPYEHIGARVRASGKQRCQTIALEVTANRPYFAEFVQRYCAHWGLQPARATQEQKKKLKDLYRAVDFQPKVEGLPTEVIPVFKEALESALQKTAWFDAKGGRVLRIALDGKYTKQREEHPENRIHSYSVQIPYTSYESVTKERQVPYTDYEYRCVANPSSPTGNSCSNVAVTKYRTEQYSETEPVTRYRSEPRTQPYNGTKISQLLALALEGKAAFSVGVGDFSLTERSQTSGFESDWKLPDIGLYPEHANVPDPLAWMKIEALSLAANFESRANELWDSYYCKPLGNAQSLASSGEQVHRCLRRKPTELPRFISLWYENNLGVSLTQADEILGLKDL